MTVGLLDKVKKRAAKALLPVLNDEQLIETLPREKLAAEHGLVPKRCGLCRFYSRSLAEEELQKNPAMLDAMKLLKPSQMGRARTEPYKHPGSERARELRPALMERWEDFGACVRHNEDGLRIIWGFAEQPAMPEPEDPPCEEWRT